jgi:hypothetical protein
VGNDKNQQVQKKKQCEPISQNRGVESETDPVGVEQIQLESTQFRKTAETEKESSTETREDEYTEQVYLEKLQGCLIEAVEVVFKHFLLPDYEG